MTGCGHISYSMFKNLNLRTETSQGHEIWHVYSHMSLLNRQNIKKVGIQSKMTFLMTKKSFKITVPDWGLIFEAFSLRKRNSRRYTTKQFQKKKRDIQYCFNDDKT